MIVAGRITCAIGGDVSRWIDRHAPEPRHDTEYRALVAEQRDRRLRFDPLICRKPVRCSNSPFSSSTYAIASTCDAISRARSSRLRPDGDEVPAHANDLRALRIQLDVAAKDGGPAR